MISSIVFRLKSVTGLITVPGSLALLLWFLAWPVLALDGLFIRNSQLKLPYFFQLEYQTALNVVSTIAASAITTLSLVYSIVLVVFTLAAGNIAPRLLQRFTKDRVNQVTAGLLGGTYLFSLTILHQTDAAFTPPIAVATALFLAALTVLQLIYFVHTVSKSVTIDQEIASISERLEKQLALIVSDEETKAAHKDEFESAAWCSLKADKAGYLKINDPRFLVKTVSTAKTKLHIIVKPGTFLLKGAVFAVYRPLEVSDAKQDMFLQLVRQSIALSSSRGAGADVEYDINLIIEIALRALSPGVNDTYTAIACVDRLSAAYQDIVQCGLSSHGLHDDEGRACVLLEGLEVNDLLNTAFNPLRRAAASNVLMLHHLGDALLRLHDVANTPTQREISRHIALMLEEFKNTNPLQNDIDFLEDRFADIT